MLRNLILHYDPNYIGILPLYLYYFSNDNSTDIFLVFITYIL